MRLSPITPWKGPDAARRFLTGAELHHEPLLDVQRHVLPRGRPDNAYGEVGVIDLEPAGLRVSNLLARALADTYGPLAGPRAWVKQIEPAKWIGGLSVVLISLLVTHAWDKLRVRYRLDVVQYWTMIGLALSICLLVALLSGGF